MVQEPTSLAASLATKTKSERDKDTMKTQTDESLSFTF